jgi:hypothetical protein
VDREVAVDRCHLVTASGASDLVAHEKLGTIPDGDGENC